MTMTNWNIILISTSYDIKKLLWVTETLRNHCCDGNHKSIADKHESRTRILLIPCSVPVFYSLSFSFSLTEISTLGRGRRILVPVSISWCSRYSTEGHMLSLWWLCTNSCIYHVSFQNDVVYSLLKEHHLMLYPIHGTQMTHPQYYSHYKEYPSDNHRIDLIENKTQRIPSNWIDNWGACNVIVKMDGSAFYWWD